MARLQRTWADLRAEIRRLLREETAATSGWSDAALLDMFNHAVDLRSIELMNADEGWLRESTPISLVAGQSKYSIPEGYGGRVPRVVLVRSEGGNVFEVPLARDERYSTPVYHPAAGVGSWSYLPTVRIEGNTLVLEPRPTDVTNLSLRLEVEAAGARLTGDGSKLPPSFPDIAETLLVYDTVNLALASEHAQTNLDSEVINGLLRFHASLEAAWRLYIDNRITRPIVVGRRHYLGD